MDSLSLEQRIAFDKFICGENLFITGPGGTGKTKLIHHITNYADDHAIPYQVCAMTGCAAILLGCKARTLHSWSGIRLAKGPRDDIVKNAIKNYKARKAIKGIRLLIIDEVSMMSQKIFEIVDEICCEIRGNYTRPFGGIQVIFTGDFFQLPPVGSRDEPDTMSMCFESPLWDTVFKHNNVIELKTIFRQNDPIYIDILSQIRKGSLTPDYAMLLKSYVRREYDADAHYGCVPTKLFSLRNKAEYINNLMFEKIDAECYTVNYKCNRQNTKYIDSGANIPYKLLKECQDLNESDIIQELTNLYSNMQCEQVFQFKVGAVVMCTKNINLEDGICNGSIGVVIGVTRDPDNTPIPIVQYANGVKMTMMPAAWQSDIYPTLSVHQIPLRLAWALTIHKIQGATMDMAEMDVGNTVFEYGQIYVALSRIKSLNGLYLLNFSPEKIKANPKVVAFYNRFEKHTPTHNNTLLHPVGDPLLPDTSVPSSESTSSSESISSSESVAEDIIPPSTEHVENPVLSENTTVDNPIPIHTPEPLPKKRRTYTKKTTSTSIHKEAIATTIRPLDAEPTETTIMPLDAELTETPMRPLDAEPIRTTDMPLLKSASKPKARKSKKNIE